MSYAKKRSAVSAVIILVSYVLRSRVSLCYIYQRQEWKRKFQRFRSATYLDLDDNARQIETLLYVMGKVGDDIYNQLNLSDQVTPEGGDTRDRTYEEVIHAFDRYF